MALHQVGHPRLHTGCPEPRKGPVGAAPVGTALARDSELEARWPWLRAQGPQDSWPVGPFLVGSGYRAFLVCVQVHLVSLIGLVVVKN